MKKIIVLAALVLFAQTMVFAQKAKTVSEKDVPERFVKDFQKKAPEAKNVTWTLVDSMVYDATFVNENATKQSYRFSNKGTEVRWFVAEKYYPHAIKDAIKEQYPNHKIKEVYVLSIKNKMTYQVRIAKGSKKKEKDAKIVNFETDGKFIDVIDVR